RSTQAPPRHFARPITPECLACHANRADAVPHAVNNFRKPIFEGYAIGCERCHGPGELHVRTSDKLDIVDPKRLAPALRDSVCEQCHLSGVGRILRHGRGWTISGRGFRRTCSGAGLSKKIDPAAGSSSAMPKRCTRVGAIKRATAN